MMKCTQRQLKLSMTSLIGLLALMILQACEPGPQKINFSITALDTNSLPVSGVYIYLSSYEAAWGATDADGRFQGESVAKVGDTISFRLEAPEGYTLIPSQDTSFQVTENDQPLLVEYTGQFKPPEREYLFMVEGKKDDQVLINNKDIVNLGSSGRSSILYSGPPGEEFIIQVGVQGYRGILSTGKEVYLITPEKQGALLNPDLFMGPLQAALESDAELNLALPNQDNSQEEEEELSLDLNTDEVEAKEDIAMAIPKVSPKPRSKSRKSSSSRRPKRASPRTNRPKRQKTPKREQVRSNSYESRKSAYTVELEETRSPAPPVSPPPRKGYQKPQRTKSATRRSTYGDSGDSSASAVLSSLKTQKRSDNSRSKYNANSRSKYNANSRSKDNANSRASSPSRSTSGSRYNANSNSDYRDTSSGRSNSNSAYKSDSSSRNSSGSRPAQKMPSSQPIPSGGVASMSKKDVKAKLKEIEKRYERSNRLTAQDVSFLKMLNRKHGISYYSAHRLLGYFYYSLNDIRRQKDSLTIAVKKGRYKHDPNVLLSLAQAYGHFKQYTSAIKYLRRAESKMNRMKGAGKANVYRTYAEYLRLKYVSQKARNPLQADTGLLDKAIQKWKNLLTLSGGGGRDGADARTQITKLERMKAEAGGL